MTSAEATVPPEDPSGMSRRQLLTRGAVAGVGIAGMMLIEACAPSENDQPGDA